MLKKTNPTIIIIALCISAALIAFAFDQRVTLSATAFYISAAVTCLSPVLYALLRCKIRRNKTPNVA
jgi:hypothetical protein